MNILTYDTSGTDMVLALQVNDYQAFAKETVGRTKLSRLRECLNEMFHTIGSDVKQIDYLLVGQGPGSFTGLRIAAAFAQGLAFGLDCNLITFSSLQSIAQTAYEQHGHTEVHVLRDARMEEVYHGHYRVDSFGIMHPLQADELCPINIIDELSDKTCVGSACQTNEEIQPTSLLNLATHYIEQQPFISGNKLKPNYLRNKVTH